MATLASQHPVAYKEWVAAGGIEDNFRDHLLATGTLPVTSDDVFRVSQRALAQLQGLITQLRR